MTTNERCGSCASPLNISIGGTGIPNTTNKKFVMSPF